MQPGSGQKPLVLVVDDFKMIRESFARILAGAGYEVAQAASAEECLARAAGMRPDVILMDLSLPAMSGLDALRELRKQESTRETPVIFLTAHGQEIESAIPAGVGFHGVLSKPCTPEEVIAKIKSVLESAEPSRARIAGAQ